MKPLILDFKEVRKDLSTKISYKYDFSKSLNTATIMGDEKPYIDLETSDVELLTKTKVHRENDDNNIHLELKTKTEVRKERDDLHNSLIEFQTKTFTRRESDDR